MRSVRSAMNGFSEATPVKATARFSCSVTAVGKISCWRYLRWTNSGSKYRDCRGCKVDCVNGHRIEQTRRTDGNRPDRHETDRHPADRLQEARGHHWQEWPSQAVDESPFGAGDARRAGRACGL